MRVAVRPGARTFRIDGELELLGVKRPLTLQATWNESAPSPTARDSTCAAYCATSPQNSASRPMRKP